MYDNGYNERKFLCYTTAWYQGAVLIYMVIAGTINRVAFYCRVNHRDRDYEKYLDDVMRRLEEEYGKQKWDLQIFFEEASGADPNRKEFNRLKAEIAAKGVMGCANRHVEEETLIKAYLMAWNALVENREDFMGQWTEQLQSENLLEGYRAEKFIEYTDEAEPLTEMDTDFMLKTLDHIKVFEDGTLLVVFLDGTEIECKNEEE